MESYFEYDLFAAFCLTNNIILLKNLTGFFVIYAILVLLKCQGTEIYILHTRLLT